MCMICKKYTFFFDNKFRQFQNCVFSVAIWWLTFDCLTIESQRPNSTTLIGWTGCTSFKLYKHVDVSRCSVSLFVVQRRSPSPNKSTEPNCGQFAILPPDKRQLDSLGGFLLFLRCGHFGWYKGLCGAETIIKGKRSEYSSLYD